MPDAHLNGVILDMDGVLVHSEPFIQEACTRFFADFGVTLTHEDFGPFVGTGEGRFLSGMAEKYRVTIDVDDAKARTYALYGELVRDRLQPVTGAHAFIEACRQRGLRVAVASSADAIKVAANLTELRLTADVFDAVVTGSDVVRKKPAPDIFLTAAERLRLPPNRCLVVEDAINGVEAALAAGARCLALTTSFPAERLTAAHWTAPHLGAVPTAVWAALAGPPSSLLA